MKRGVLAFAIAMTAAGVASALGPLPPLPPRPAQTETQPTPSPVPKLAASATLEARQAPVPLVLKPRPAPEPRKVDANATVAAEPPKTDSVGEGRARSAIEADGYKGVKVLRKGANGLWYAEAMRGKDRVLITVDAQGNVAQE
jgi:hypothetical protein